MEKVYEKEAIVLTEYDPNNKIIYVYWAKLFGHPYLKECVQTHVDLVKNRGAKALVIDVSKATGLPTAEEQQWFGNSVFPEYSRYGLKVMITLLPESALTRLSAQKWNQTASNFSFKIFETDDKASIQEILKAEKII